MRLPPMPPRDSRAWPENSAAPRTLDALHAVSKPQPTGAQEPGFPWPPTAFLHQRRFLMPQAQSATLTLNESDPLSELEAAMRRALGAMGPARSRSPSGQRAGVQASFTPRRTTRFVRDGEVLVEHVTAPRSRAAHADGQRGH